MLMNRDAGLLPWIQLYNSDYPWNSKDLLLTMENIAPPLYYTALIGLSQVVEKVTLQFVDVNAQGGRYGNALQAASARGHKNVVQILVNDF